ncbi:MAG: 2-oxoglutarate and iron-dependent oxygenase domain-containing protein [Pseudomonadota bacterium]
MTIPLIDLSGALLPGGRRSADVAVQLRQAAESAGFFYIANHGMEPHVIQRQFALVEQLFDLSGEQKDAVSTRHSSCSRGYEALGSQTLDPGARPDLKESFYCGIDYPPEHPYAIRKYHTYGMNQWPAGLSELAAASTAYISTMCRLAVRLMQLMALSLQLPEDYFDHMHGSPMVTLRFLRYPPQPADADDKTFGAGAHTDWGAITILAQDAHGGLEVSMPDGSWVASPPIPGTLVVNLGDMIPRWTNGHYHSNPHRVRNTFSGAKPRHSIPFFYNPDYEALVQPVPTCPPVAGHSAFKPCTVGEHLRAMHLKTHA